VLTVATKIIIYFSEVLAKTEKPKTENSSRD
jgi:hypothetical protein